MKKWFHAIGVSGKTTANIAKMFKDMGWFVTGTDNQFFPPASLIVKENKIPHEEGFNYKHMQKDYWEEALNQKLDISQVPDLTMIVESASPKNKEYLFAKNKGLDIRPYSKILSEYLIKDNSIVVAGTAGKTTTTSLITKILIDLGFDPSYMIGAEVKDLKESIMNTKSEWSVIEGDEYFSKEFSTGAKFLEYKVRYLVLTNIGYEHQDVYPTEELYVEEFAKLVSAVPQDGIIVARNKDEKISETLKTSIAKIIRYEISTDVKNIKDGVWSLIKREDENIIYDGNKNEILRFKTELLGEFVLEDILAGVTLVLNLPAESIPLDFAPKGTEYLEDLRESVESFEGVKKRLEILYQDDYSVIIDDFGVAPERAKNSLNVIRSSFPEYRIYAIFEPNSASRFSDHDEFIKNYKGVFDGVDTLIIPDLSDFNKDLVSADEFINYLKEINIRAIHVKNSDIANLVKGYIGNDKIVIVFFSSYRLDSVAKQVIQDI